MMIYMKKLLKQRILLRGAAILLSLLLLIPCARGEETNMDTVPVTLQKSYKKAGENNPLYTQRFGADFTIDRTGMQHG